MPDFQRSTLNRWPVMGAVARGEGTARREEEVERRVMELILMNPTFVLIHWRIILIPPQRATA